MERQRPISCIVFFGVERIYGACEEENREIGCFNGAPRSNIALPAEGSVCFCKDEGRFANGNN